MTEDYDNLRYKMVKHQIEARGIKDENVLRAMRKIPRHLFVPQRIQNRSYDDTPLPIGLEQTISQPYIVAFMTAKLQLDKNSTVLEIGTGSGYQTAVLAEIAKHIYTIEIVCELLERAERILEKLGYTNITTKCGDGSLGWQEYAPFDAIIVTAAPRSIPKPLVEQL